MARKLYVGNLPFSAGEAELQELFAQAGAVDSVKVMRDMATGRARGFAFVEMATDEDAQKAIDKFHNYSFGGRNLTVNEARPRPERSGGFGGGGYGGGGGGRGGGGRDFGGGGGGGYGGGGGKGGRREPRW
jgi:RNA recognition motif-containing protein